MDLENNTVLITGGSAGIGFALAEKFVKAGSKVIVCGRRKEVLDQAKEKLPELDIYACDVGVEKERIDLFNWVSENYPDINVLINNAGIQRWKKLSTDEEWSETQKEIAINFEAPIHLANLFIPHLLKVKNPYIINVTSGLSFSPLVIVPIYCATKAALHSYTLSLRENLSKTPIKVVEIIPPAVDTDLGGIGLHTMGVPLNEFTDAIIPRLKNRELEISYGTAEKSSKASRQELDNMFVVMNKNRD